jgi:hypothetical protein
LEVLEMGWVLILRMCADDIGVWMVVAWDALWLTADLQTVHTIRIANHFADAVLCAAGLALSVPCCAQGYQQGRVKPCLQHLLWLKCCPLR